MSLAIPCRTCYPAHDSNIQQEPGTDRILLKKLTLTTHLANRGQLDFVETPSTLMEYFAASPKVMPLYAHHYKTGDPIPAKDIEALHVMQPLATTCLLTKSALSVQPS